MCAEHVVRATNLTAAQIAECLGLEADDYRKEYSRHDVEDGTDQTLRSLLSDEERYKTAEPLELKCAVAKL